MTEENLFREVDEDMERLKYEALWKRYGVYVVATIVAIVLGTAASSYQHTRKIAENQKASGELLAIMGDAKVEQEKKIANLLGFAENNAGQAQATLAEFHAAAFAAQKGDKDNAIKIYDTLAADAKADHAFRQLADLLAVEQQLDSGDVAKLQSRLQPLLDDKEPWHFSAREMNGYLAIRAGDKAKAKEIFTSLSQDVSVPQSLGARANDMLRLLSE